MKYWTITVFLLLFAAGAVAPTAGATELVWQPRLALDTNSLVTLAFNNTRAVVRSRDGQRVYLAWKSKGASNALHFAVLTNNVLARDLILVSNANANALTIEETPAGHVATAHTEPGKVIVLASTNQGAAFFPVSTLVADGPQANPSLSFSDAGDGYLLWHSATSPTVLYTSTLTNGAAGWSAPAVLATGLDDPQFASVWARSGVAPVAAWRADANPLPAGEKWTIQFLDWTNGATPVSLPTTNCFDPSVFRFGDQTFVAWFSIEQKINLAIRTNPASGFGSPVSFPNFGRFPHLEGNARGVVAVCYEYTDVQGQLTNDNLKKIGLRVSFDRGANFTNGLPADLAAMTNQIAASVWVSDGWVDLLWVDRAENVLRYQAAAIVYPPEISDIMLAGTNVVISFFASAGKTHALEYKDDLDATNWLPHPATPIAGDGRPQFFSFPVNAPTQRFFRLVQQ